MQKLKQHKISGSRSVRPGSDKARASADEAPGFPTIPTAGCILEYGSRLELARQEGRNVLLHGDAGGRYSWSAEEVVENKCRYVPTSAADFISHLPTGLDQYGSTQSLFSEVRQFIATHAGLDEHDSTLLTFVALASHFPDCLATLPCVLLFGAPYHAVSLLRVLACVCRHSILSVGSGTALAPELRPTWLIGQADGRLDRQLPAMQFTGFNIIDGSPRPISGTSVIFVGERELKNPLASFALHLWVSPTVHLFGVQEEAQCAKQITSLQNKLLVYRVKNWSKVKNSTFDAPEFSGATREYARTMGRCIVDAPELQKQLIALLREHDDAERTEDARAIDAAIIEALVVCCHERKQPVHVGEIATLANAIFTRTGETFELRARQVGGRLKRLGFRTTRLDASGRGVYLLNGECERVHRLGRALAVPTLGEKLPACPFCNNGK